MHYAILCPGQGKSSEQSQLSIVEASIASYLTLDLPKSKLRSVVGLSLGEYSALYCAGILTRKDVLGLVEKRRGLMDKTCAEYAGKMAAILGLDNLVVETICEKINGVWPANYLYQGQIVVSGLINAVDEVTVVARDMGARVIELRTKGAFHTPLMESANKQFSHFLEVITFSQPKIAFYSTVSGEKVGSPSKAKELLMEQMTSPVCLERAIRKMIDDGVTDPIELEPSGVLTKIFRKIIGL